MQIQTLIKNITSELDDVTINKQRKRYLENYKVELEKYLKNNPNSSNVPTSLELFCDLNPSAPECIKYDV